MAVFCLRTNMLLDVCWMTEYIISNPLDILLIIPKLEQYANHHRLKFRGNLYHQKDVNPQYGGGGGGVMFMQDIKLSNFKNYVLNKYFI